MGEISTPSEREGVRSAIVACVCVLVFLVVWFELVAVAVAC